MKLLLDTHVLIWLIEGNTRLGQQTRGLLNDNSHELLISYITPLEMVMKAAKDKLSYDDRLFDVLSALGITLLHQTRQSLRAYRVYNPANKDPFDNMLLAVAEAEDCVFVTADAAILNGPAPVKLLDARL